MRIHPLLKATKALGQLAGVLIATLAMYGQTNTATLTGSVSDATHAAIPRANLEVRSIQTGLVKSVLSNDEGQFTFNFLPVGTYELTAGAKGFQTMERKGL